MSTHARPTWTLGASRKRKDRHDPCEPPQTAQAAQLPVVQPASGSRLLAGYLAHEYLTKGTLLGKPMGRALPCRTEAGERRDLNKAPDSTEPMVVAPETQVVGSYYAEVSRLLMRPEGPHVPGVVNPTQLAQWLEM